MVNSKFKYLFIGLVVSYGVNAIASQVTPTPLTPITHNGTATGSAVTVLSAGSSVVGYRSDCFLQNNGTHNMYYSFVGTASSSTTVLAPGYSMNCANGVGVTQSALSLLGTNGDTYVLHEDFITAQ